MQLNFWTLNGPRAKGAALVEHGILVGLIAVVAIGAVSQLGGKVSETFMFATEEVAMTDGDGVVQGEKDANGGADGAAEPAPGATMEQDSFDEGTPLNVASNRRLVFLDPSPYGFSGSNSSVHHANTASRETSGLAWLEIPDGKITYPGRYEASLIVGNFNNKPFISQYELGMRSGENYLTSVASNMPVPASGSTEVWTMSYEITQEQIDAGLSFAIDVIYDGQNHNASFDDLEIVYAP